MRTEGSGGTGSLGLSAAVLVEMEHVVEFEHASVSIALSEVDIILGWIGESPSNSANVQPRQEISSYMIPK